MKILIAGGAGYIGSALIPNLLRRGYDVTVLDLLWFGNNLPNDIEIIKMTDLPRVVAESDVGSIAKVEIWRKNKIITIEVELGELPEKIYVPNDSKKKDDQLTETVIKSLGISITDSKNKKGVLVSKVNDENINLKKGDKILEVNREIVDSTKTFISLVDKYEQTGRSSLLLKIQRDEGTRWETLKFIN